MGRKSPSRFICIVSFIFMIHLRQIYWFRRSNPSRLILFIDIIRLMR